MVYSRKIRLNINRPSSSSSVQRILHPHATCNPHRHVTTTFARHHHYHSTIPGFIPINILPVLSWRNFIKYCSFCSSAADFTILQKFAAKKLDINLLCQPTSAPQPGRSLLILHHLCVVCFPGWRHRGRPSVYLSFHPPVLSSMPSTFGWLVRSVDWHR